MAGKGHERRPKHCQEAGGYWSSQISITNPKKLSKRARPISPQEESSLEGSPTHGCTPMSHDEFECLKIHSPIIHTNREVVNYSKEDPMNLVTIHNKPCYNLPKERGTDERF
jgi:hypothetical protein